MAVTFRYTQVYYREMAGVVETETFLNDRDGDDANSEDRKGLGLLRAS